MANIYDRRRQQQQLLHYKTNIFLPMFCRLSLKDINFSRRRRDSSPSDEPSSPKVSCMGQVKKRNNRVSAAAATPTHTHRYSKLRKLFSSKTLLPATTAACIAAAAGGNELVCADNLRRLRVKRGDCERDCAKVVDVGELDPPLPVLKKAAAAGGDGANLWKRRFNGAALKTLQIENISSSNVVSLPPTV